MAKAVKKQERQTDLFERLKTLEETYVANLNILEDFDEEKTKLKEFQQATFNILADFDQEKARLKEFQQSTLNILEDMFQERTKLDRAERALINILEDVEKQRSQAEQSKNLLELVNKELEAFSYSVSHDLRAPLRAIYGFTQAIDEDYAPRLDEEGKRYLKLVKDNTEKMGQLIDDLLTFSRIGRREMVKTEIDLKSLSRAIFDEMVSEEPDRDIELIIRTMPPANGDESLIRQVLVNLLSNAIKFSRPRKKALIEFGYQPKKEAYYVKDNGVGFDMQYAGKLFGVFQRLHGEEFEGTGVGLALVNRIVTRHGGRVWAKGKVDEGATFFFTLPKTETEYL